jgi:outer membrane protein OmpA-like peptidoglycan-associated protein
MEARGFGETSPRAKGASAAARQQNRRVEIGIVDTVIEYKAQTEER